MRVSSTQINCFLDCPERWRLDYVLGLAAPAGEAAAVGSLFHSCMEFRLHHGAWPSARMLASVPGNYDSPVDIMRRWPRAFDEAVALAQAVGDPWQFIPEDVELLDVELSFDARGLRACHGEVEVGGYLDLVARDRDGCPVILDWKTRGKRSWGSRPTTPAAFEANIQFVYYACAVMQLPEFAHAPRARVEHINVLRDSPGVVHVDGATFTREFLDVAWATLERDVLSAMLAVYKASKEFAHKERASCFKYGRCPHLAQCGPNRKHVEPPPCDLGELPPRPVPFESVLDMIRRGGDT
jgi:hypothetical protein